MSLTGTPYLTLAIYSFKVSVTGFPSGENYCPGELDGWRLCWNATPPGQVARQPCPQNSNAWAFRECSLNGTWFVHPESQDGKPWTNYTQCIDTDELSVSENAFNLK